MESRETFISRLSCSKSRNSEPPGAPKPEQITAAWTFGGKWDPERTAGPAVAKVAHKDARIEIAWSIDECISTSDPSDAAMDGDKDGYTNLEEYLNGTNPKQFVDYRIPANDRGFPAAAK